MEAEISGLMQQDVCRQRRRETLSSIIPARGPDGAHEGHRQCLRGPSSIGGRRRAQARSRRVLGLNPGQEIPIAQQSDMQPGQSGRIGPGVETVEEALTGTDAQTFA